MIIRDIKLEDAEKFLNMLKQLDKETKYMLFEENERSCTVEDMKERLGRRDNKKHTIFIVEDNGEIVGFLSGDRGAANRIKHSAYVVIGMLEPYRGKGIGVALIEELFKWARNNKIIRLELTVVKDNRYAVNLYKKMGFKVEGIREKAMIVDGKYVDEYYMGRIL
ncbi:acetyltransferase domain protein [Clostridium baratii str. Sullivan]|uniref:Acetyltransferase domain protein n=1 Tax=Clostridium baratii str. Sullivan TaxID=1415775 RepID=A0A0A7FX38_9CLOT|nr:GNAT family N-acetyltransferase [Clostridium baratii]AIY83500.1 acetyltransferase domain protein [Clostridium baratii str. Sullivan]